MKSVSNEGRDHGHLRTPTQHPSQRDFCLSPPTFRRPNSRGDVTPSFLNMAFSFEYNVDVGNCSVENNDSLPQDHAVGENRDNSSDQADLEVEHFNSNANVELSKSSRRVVNRFRPRSGEPPVIPIPELNDLSSSPFKEKIRLSPKFKPYQQSD